MHENSPHQRRRLPAAGRGLAVLAAGLACTAGLAAGSPAQAATGPGPMALPPGNTQLNAVSADSASDAWAVGSAYTAPAGSGVYQSLALHWNGTSWAKAKTPNPGGTSTLGGANGTFLTGVAALSPTNAWAVGYYQSKPSLNRSLILHWNGTKWATVPSPNPGGSTVNSRTELFSVSAASATSIWAAGYETTSKGEEQTLVLHWDGSTWAKVTTPNPGSAPYGDWLSQVKAISGTDAWAVGAYHGKGTTGGNHALMLHWNGTAWAKATVPNPTGTSDNTVMTGVGASSASNVWSVGFYNTATVNNNPLAMRLKGSAWSQVTMPNPSTDGVVLLNGVDTAAAASGWAVGSYGAGSGADSASLSLIVQWNGTKWTQVKSPNPAGTSEAVNNLTGVDARTSTDAWAVGYYSHGTPYQTMILHWNGTSWTQVKSPN